MKIIKNDYLHNFEFWEGAVCRAELLTYDELDRVGNILDELYPDGIEDMQINDLFWFDFDTVLDWLGYEYDANKDDYGLKEYKEKQGI